MTHKTGCTLCADTRPMCRTDFICQDAVREFSTIVRNVNAGNEAELAAWESASHVERAPRRAKEEEEEPPTEPPTAQG